MVGVPVFTPDQVRAAEEPLLRVQGLELMKAAAFAFAVECAEVLARRRPTGVSGARVVVLCGPGNNGGDGLFAASELARRGAHITVLASTDMHAEGTAALAARRQLRVTEDPAVVDGADLVIDALLGIGGRGGLRAPWDTWAHAVAEARAAGTAVVAVDVPSGASPVGEDLHDGSCIEADVTVTFGGLKPVHVLQPAVCGEVVLCGVGIDTQLAAQELHSPAGPEMWLVTGGVWPVPGNRDHKYSLGTVALHAGSARYPGAGVLAAAGAVRATSSMVRIAGDAAASVIERFPSVVAASGRSDARVIGPGRGTESAAAEELHAALESPEPLVVDADAVTLLAHDESLRQGLRQRSARGEFTVLTPHEGEYLRLAAACELVPPDARRESVFARRVDAVQSLARELGCVVLLKGRVTIVSEGHAPAYVITAPTSWAATPGSGDVLSGVVGALLAASPQAAAVALAAYAHAQATADVHAPIDALHLAEHLTPAIARIIADTQR
ncbi:NAD(P)H-hydrate epimerase [Corynebacterium sp. 13CS0277]|uniref:NAD(P)H-hydrate epimerase n=1 Tax=Corynebacterium sp. 13CS0277 TaxID=2071994 RepID=UPI0035126167